MRYVVVMLLGILLGAGVAMFFMGAPSAKSVPGTAIRPPDPGGNPPATVVISLEQSFIDAVLATTFTGLGTPTFQLGRADTETTEQFTPALFQGGCNNSITMLADGSGVKTGVQFQNGKVTAPMAFTGSYNLAGCLQFRGWAQSDIRLQFDEAKQTRSEERRVGRDWRGRGAPESG